MNIGEEVTTTIFSISNIVLGSVFIKMLPKENNMQCFLYKAV